MSDVNRRTTRPPLTEAQQLLVKSALGLVHRIVRATVRRRPHANQEELESAGFEALSEAAQTYDPTKNDNFPCYAWAHVYGAIAEQLSKSTSSATGAVSAARRMGLDLAEGLRDDSDPFAETTTEVERRVREACDDVTAAVMFGLRGDRWSELGEESMISRVDHRRAAAALHGELSRWPEQDRRLVELRYRDRMALRKVAEALGISKSAAGRRCVVALNRLRDALASQGITSTPGL